MINYFEKKPRPPLCLVVFHQAVAARAQWVGSNGTLWPILFFPSNLVLSMLGVVLYGNPQKPETTCPLKLPSNIMGGGGGGC